MAAVVPATRTSTFSNGTDQVLANTAVLNAGGNIIYFEWNPWSADRSSARAPSQGDVNTAVDSLSSVVAMMSEMTSPTPKPHQPHSEQPSLSNLKECAPASLLVDSTPSTSNEPAPLHIDLTSRTPKTPERLSHSSDSPDECSEAGTHVNVTPSHEAEFCPPLTKGPSSCEVYAEKMFPLKHGYPLWYPQPERNLPIEYRRKGVTIGDVGFITSDGTFDFLFNIWNQPGNFGSVSPPQFQTIYKAAFPPRSMISSTSNIDYEVDWRTMDISYSYHDKDSGVILCMPHGASQEDYKNERVLKGFIGMNAESWYRYALKCGRDLDRHSLYLVTGSLKSKTWGIVTYDTTTLERLSTVVLGKSPDPEGPVYEWKKTGKASTFRTGPVPDATTDTQSRLPETDNQCLFLRGFKISLSEEAWKEIDIENSVYNKLNGKRRADYDGSSDSRKSKKSRGNEESSSNPNENNTVDITNFPLKQNLFHPLNVINDMLFSQVQGSRVAITHDNQWFEGGFRNLENNPDFYSIKNTQQDTI
ncbi:hypothetical protein BDQ17DRAFT_1031931 [Cyathus striatus]|nr:hypothetical protein BDQ17DRAFT_1031931 [Cyathus striatus]